MDNIKPTAHPAHLPIQQAPSVENITTANSPDFKTPDEVANNESGQPVDSADKTGAAKFGRTKADGSKPGQKLHHRLNYWWKSLSKKQKILVLSAAVLILGIAIGGSVLAITHHHKPAPIAAVKPKPKVVIPPKPTTVASNLTGLQVDPSVNQRPVTGVMIENSPDARPQSGLDQAGVVFEAVAEGGITRFLAIFQDTQPGYLGPVRSVRPYYIQWSQGFDAAIAHVGGSPEALQDMKDWNVKDLDQFYNGSYYQRITARYAPHNVYTSIAQLNQLEASKGYGAVQFTGFARKVDQPIKTPTASSIDLRPSSGNLYEVHYDYVAASNNYKRSEDNAPHMEVDANGVQTQITPKVVVALIMHQGIEADGEHTSYATIGSGQAYVFQDGEVTTGNWTKASNTAQIVLTDASSKPIELDAGQTWFTILGDATDVSYKP